MSRSQATSNHGNHLVSPRDLAAAIGVSESSLKRWVDEGLLAASRTIGNHRRIALAEAVRFIRQRRLPLVRPEALGLTDVEMQFDAASSLSERLFIALLNGDAPASRRLIVSSFLGGASAAELADGPIRHAMTRLGELWQHQNDGVFIEHRATDICLQAVNQIRTFLQAPTDAPAAVGGAPAGDPYALPSVLAACVLTENGLSAVNLGPDTPAESFIQAAQRHRARLCWLSISVESDAREATAKLTDMARELAALQCRLIVGGRGTDRLRLSSIDNLFRCDSMASLAAIARPSPQPSQQPDAKG